MSKVNLRHIFRCGRLIFSGQRDTLLSQQQKKEEEAKLPPETNIYIKGSKIVGPYEKHEYTIYGVTDGTWSIDNPKKAVIKKSSYSSALVDHMHCKAFNSPIRKWPICLWKQDKRSSGYYNKFFK